MRGGKAFVLGSGTRIWVGPRRGRGLVSSPGADSLAGCQLQAGKTHPQRSIILASEPPLVMKALLIFSRPRKRSLVVGQEWGMGHASPHFLKPRRAAGRGELGFWRPGPPVSEPGRAGWPWGRTQPRSSCPSVYGCTERTQEGTQPWAPRDCGSGHLPAEKGSHFSFRPCFSICRSRELDRPSSTVLFIFKGSVVYKRCLGPCLQFP